MFILSSDYDGTFKSDYELDIKINIAFVKKFMERGNIFILNTGRPYESIKEEITKYNIPYNYLACTDGNILFNNKDEVIYCSRLNTSCLEDFNNLGKKYNMEIKPVYFRGNLIELEISEPYNEKIKQEIEMLCNKYSLVLKAFEEEHKTCYFIGKRDFSKCTPIQYVKKVNGIENDNIYTIGDHVNDIDMLKEYNGYTLPWGKEEAKEVSKEVLRSVSKLIKKITR